MIYGLLVFIYVVVCLFLILVVLLQSGKAADLAGAFGGMGSQTAFGPRGSATLLSKLTTISAALFMVLSLTLAIMASSGAGATGVNSVLDKATSKPAQTAPAPAPKAPAGVETPGQPMMEVTPEGGGPTQRIPIQLPPRPDAGGQQPAPAPAKK